MSVPSRFFILASLAAILALTSLLSLLVGAIHLSPEDALRILTSHMGLASTDGIDETRVMVLEQLRLPRLLLGVLTGAALGAAGCTLQGLFRNPLADPGLLGVSTGAALGAVLVIVLGAGGGIAQTLGTFAIPSAAFAGGLIATILVYRLGQINGRSDMATMLLAGIAINAVAAAATSLLTYYADDLQLRGLVFWQMGSLGNNNWQRLAIAIPLLLGGLLVLPRFAGLLNAVLLGEAEARHLGFHLERDKKILITLVALLVGIAVSLTGVIGFVGLVAPHILRLISGPDHRILLPGSALLGAILLVAADMAARLVAQPAEIPIGVITALLGGPFFLWLLVKSRNRMTNR